MTFWSFPLQGILHQNGNRLPAIPHTALSWDISSSHFRPIISGRRTEPRLPHQRWGIIAPWNRASWSWHRYWRRFPSWHTILPSKDWFSRDPEHLTTGASKGLPSERRKWRGCKGWSEPNVDERWDALHFPLEPKPFLHVALIWERSQSWAWILQVCQHSMWWLKVTNISILFRGGTSSKAGCPMIPSVRYDWVCDK